MWSQEDPESAHPAPSANDLCIFWPLILSSFHSNFVRCFKSVLPDWFFFLDGGFVDDWNSTCKWGLMWSNFSFHCYSMAATICFFVSRIVLWFFLLFFCTPIKMLMKKRKKAKTEAAKVKSQVFFWRQWKLEPAVEWLHPLFTWCFQSLSDVTPPAFNAGLARGCFSSSSSSLCSSSSSSSGGDGGRRLTSPRRDRCGPAFFHVGSDSHRSHLLPSGGHFPCVEKFFFSNAAKQSNCNYPVSVFADSPSPRWRHRLSISARGYKF